MQLKLSDIEGVCATLFILFSVWSSYSVFGMDTKFFKPLYFMTFFSGLIILIKGQCILPPWWFWVFEGYIFLSALFSAFTWDTSRRVFNYMFGIFIVTFFLTIGKNYDIEKWLLCFRNAGLIYFFAAIVSLIVQYDKIIYYLKNVSWIGHPDILTLCTGGVNLEATWLGIFSIAFCHSRVKWPYVILSTCISALYGSRVGLIVDICVVLYFFFLVIDEKKFFKVLLVSGGGIIIFLLLLQLGVFRQVFQRFSSVGQDRGSTARLNIWFYMLQLIKKYPFGVGIGNSMQVLNNSFRVRFGESNAHNLYLQMICELGWIGGGAYVTAVGVFVAKEIRFIRENPFIVMLICYFIAAFLQFGGGESIFFCILGVCLCTAKIYMAKSDSSDVLAVLGKKD